MKRKLLFTLLVFITSLNMAVAQTGDWIASTVTINSPSPVPSLGTYTIQAIFTWSSFTPYTNANNLAQMSIALPPAVDASTGTPSLTLNNVALAVPGDVTFAQVGQAWTAVLSPTYILPSNSNLYFYISGLQIYDDQIYQTQMVTSSIQFIVPPTGDQSANNSNSNLVFATDMGAAPLPVALLNFDAALIENGTTAEVRLDWSTSMEQNSNFFEVQRSADGIDWSNIGSHIPAAGNTTTKTSYISYDDNPLSGISYYRLKQVDLDKNSFLSDIRKIIYNNPNAGSVTLFPNPTHDKLNVKVQLDEKSLIEVKVYTVDGRVVQSAMAWSEKGTSTLKLDISTLANGIYTVNVFKNKTIMKSDKVRKN